jgi:hypothetical protein
MRKIRKLLMEANPVPEHRTDELTERAKRELTDLTQASTPAAPQQNPHPLQSRRRVQVLAAAVTVVIVAGLGVGAAVLLPQNESPPLLRQDGSPPSSSDEPYFSSTKVLEKYADAIVRGTITQAIDNNDNGFPETVAMVDVRSVAKGSPVPGQTLQISYTTPGSGPEFANLKVRGEYVLLLKLDSAGSAHLVNSTQGWFRVNGEKVIAGPHNDVDLSPAVLKSLGLGQ